MTSGSSNVDLTELLQRRMAYLNQRQSVLAENVANVDTPGFKARDLEPFSFGDAMKQASVSMALTDPKHIVPVSASGVNAKTKTDDSGETLPSGNTVDVEQQMMEVSKTSVDYQSVTSIYHAIGGMFKMALKGSSS